MWYYNAPLGVNNLGNMMGNMSKKHNLSQQNTNHCLSATTISILDSAGIQRRHKLEESLKSYSCAITYCEILHIIHTSVYDTDKTIIDQDLVVASQIINNQVTKANMRSNTDFTLSHTNITQLPVHLNQPMNIQQSCIAINYYFQVFLKFHETFCSRILIC